MGVLQFLRSYTSHPCGILGNPAARGGDKPRGPSALRRGGATHPTPNAHSRQGRLRRFPCASSSRPILRSRCNHAYAPSGRYVGVGAPPGALGKTAATLAPERPHPREPTRAVAWKAEISDSVYRFVRRACELSRRDRFDRNCI